MNLEKRTAFTLRAGIVVGTLLMVAGLFMSMTGGNDSLLYWGVLVLVMSPFLGVLATFASLVIERDWYWVAIAGILIVITTVGMMLHV